MATKPAFRLISDAPSTEQMLRDTITSRDNAARTVADHDRLIVELGQRLWHERNPNQKRFMRMRAEEARKMVGL